IFASRCPLGGFDPCPHEESLRLLYAWFLRNPEPPAMTQDRLKVLLIEHDPGFARHLGDMLGQARDLSAEMRSTADLRGGLSALTGDRFDVVLMDLSVPDGAGLGNVSLIKAEARQLPIIVAGEADDETVALEAV